MNQAEIDDIDPDLWIHGLAQCTANPRRFPAVRLLIHQLYHGSPHLPGPHR